MIINYKSIHFWGSYEVGAIFFFTKVNKTVKSLKAAELECGTFRFSDSQARGIFLPHYFLPLQWCTVTEERWIYSIKSFLYGQHSSPSRKPEEKQLGDTVASLVSSGRKKEKKVTFKKITNPLRNPTWSYIFLKLNYLQRGRNSTRLCSLEIVAIK